MLGVLTSRLDVQFNLCSLLFDIHFLSTSCAQGIVLEMQLCTKQSSRIARPSRCQTSITPIDSELVTEMQAEKESSHGPGLYQSICPHPVVAW